MHWQPIRLEFVRIAWIAGVAAGCAGPHGAVAQDRPARAGDVAAQVLPPATQGPGGSDAAPTSVLRARGRDLNEFAARLAAAAAPGSSIGVLPLAYYGDLDSTPTIPQLGVDVADEIADGVRRAGFKGGLLSTSEVMVFLNDVNVGARSLHTLAGVLAEGDRLGFDVVVFGTMRLVNSGPAWSRPVRFEILALDVTTRRELVRKAAFEVEGKGENKPIFERAKQETSWTAAEGFEPSKTSDLTKELSIAIATLAKRIQRLESRAGPVDQKMQIYVAPADSSVFVGAVSRLRAMQRALWSEIERRESESTGSGAPAPLVVDGLTFERVQAARAYVTRFQEDLTATDSFRFCRRIASDLVSALEPSMSPMRVLKDFGAISLSNDDVVNVELATGGLANSASVRRKLYQEGIAVVIQPRFERLGDQFSLRAEIYNLGPETVELSTSVRLDTRYAKELARELDVRGTDGALAQRLAPIDAGSDGEAWAHVHARVGSGVVRLGQGDTFGSGFLVGDGLVMTNQHVVQGLRALPAPVATLHDGREVALTPLTVLAEDAFLDVAVLRVDKLPTGLHVFAFANEERARVGVEVAVLGHPKNTTGSVFTRGNLSSTAQTVEMANGRKRPSYMYTSATRAGTSGSPVMLRDGTVVAVNSHGALGDVTKPGPTGAAGSATLEVIASSEVPGFALGARAIDAQTVLANARRAKD